jgi:hypothetical protein
MCGELDRSTDQYGECISTGVELDIRLNDKRSHADYQTSGSMLLPPASIPVELRLLPKTETKDKRITSVITHLIRYENFLP